MYNDFLLDLQKMNNFLSLTKEEFLKSYPYITNMEYDYIKNEFSKDIVGNLADLMRQAENLHIEDLNGREYGLCFNGEQFKVVVTDYAQNNLTNEQYNEFCNLCIELAC